MERRVEKPSDSEKDMIVKVKKSVVFEGEKKRIKKKKKREENPKARRGGVLRGSCGLAERSQRPPRAF